MHTDDIYRNLTQQQTGQQRKNIHWVFTSAIVLTAIIKVQYR